MCPTSTSGPDEQTRANDLLKRLRVAGRAEANNLDSNVINELIDKGWLSTAGLDGCSLRLTPEGRKRALLEFAQDTCDLGKELIDTVYERFGPLDQHLKVVITKWQLSGARRNGQMREARELIDGEPIADQLSEIHERAVKLLSELGKRLNRYLDYRNRLTAALGRIHERDYRFVASPLLDSYHAIWFELHEDLILLSGRSRSEEAH
jgi:hypothetical protein